jgi:hypothetical protein
MRISNRKIFGFHPKVMLPQPIYAYIFVVITLVGPTKVSIMKLKCTVPNRMWQHDFMMKQIFFSLIFLYENTGQLATQVTIPDTHGMCYSEFQGFRSGVSNSNLCEDHIQKKKCFEGSSLSVKSSCGPKFTSKALRIS